MRFRLSGVLVVSSLFLASASIINLLSGGAVSYAKSGVNIPDAHGNSVLVRPDVDKRLERLEAEQPVVKRMTVFPSSSQTPVSVKPAPAASVTATKTEANPEQATTASQTPPSQPTVTEQPVTASAQRANKKQPEQMPVNEALAGLSNIHKDAIRHLDRATQLGVKGQLKAAFLEYESAIRINPKLADAYVGKAAVYGYQGQWDKAINALQTALNMDGDFISPANRMNAQFNLSSCYCFQGNSQAAWENYRQNLEGRHPRAEALLTFMDKTCPAQAAQSQAVTPATP